MNILIVGLGAIGSIYATKFKDAGYCIKALIDNERLERYLNNGIIFNGKRYDFDYVLPEDKFNADIIIIAVKSTELENIIPNLKNFITAQTKILSLLNGISSEEKIKEAYPKTEVLYSYYVGHASMKKNNSITYDGIGKIVLKKDNLIQNLFESAGIEYEVPNDIISSMWQNFIINIGINQTTAILKEPYSCFKKKEARDIAKDLMQEGVEIAKCLEIKDCEHFIERAFKLIDDMPPECKTSMLQDIENGLKTEVEIFAGEICRLSRICNVETPRNELVYRIIKSLENSLD